MPSTTAYFGELVTNLGPLTTTFTAPASCATATDHFYYGKNSSLGIIYGQPTCGFKDYGDCIPSGSAYDSLAANMYKSATQPFVHYYSPGIVCPSGWTTAGTLAHANETGPVTGSGVFTQDPYPYQIDNLPAIQLPEAKVWSEVLVESETLAFCCPSGYSGFINGACWSSVGPREELGYSSICMIYYPPEALVTIETLDGSTWTPALISLTPVTNDWKTETGVLDTTTGTYYDNDLQIHTMIPAVPLVYQATDVAAAETSDAGNSTDSDDDSAAPRTLAGPATLQLLTVLASMLAGAGLLALW
ncbi:hypothetical protein BKA56DRAFT_678008 [Ilyonectria sp. MPI-CAGE-AT-0026]|nr:hypothetical protein BKA56DRAFT_678008 [Ilyonectria sp. MPI-CAGE-AT-0026]